MMILSLSATTVRNGRSSCSSGQAMNFIMLQTGELLSHSFDGLRHLYKFGWSWDHRRSSIKYPALQRGRKNSLLSQKIERRWFSCFQPNKINTDFLYQDRCTAILSICIGADGYLAPWREQGTLPNSACGLIEKECCAFFRRAAEAER